MTLKTLKEYGQFTCNAWHLKSLCNEVWRTPGDVYALICKYGGEADTITREAIFSYIADKYYSGDYDIIYTRWLSQTAS